MDLSQIDRRRYTGFKTPIELLGNLTRILGGPNIYLKHDDMLGLAGGGNKTRKLEFLMADALRHKADTVITCGAVQSNHCRLTLAAAKKENLDAYLILEERVPNSYDPDANGNNYLFKLLGVSDIRVVVGGSDMMLKMRELAEELRAQGKNPYIIPGGGSNAIGCLGYVSCAHEIMEQSFELGIRFTHVIAPSGSGGTHTGLLTGLRGMGVETPVIGISVNRNKKKQTEVIANLVEKVRQSFQSELRVRDEDIIVFDEYVGSGYSLPTESMKEAVQLLARHEAILLDTVYTGKVMAGLIGLVRRGYFQPTDNILFVHTGGSSSLFHYRQDTL